MLIKKSLNFKFKLKPETNLIRQDEMKFLFVLKYLCFFQKICWSFIEF